MNHGLWDRGVFLAGLNRWTSGPSCRSRGRHDKKYGDVATEIGRSNVVSTKCWFSILPSTAIACCPDGRPMVSVRGHRLGGMANHS